MPEKSLNQIPRALREQYEKGVTAFQRQNFDYALSILTQVLSQEPAFFECRQALRATQFKKAGASTGFFKKVFGGASNSPLVAKGQMALRKNPLEALQIAEQILTSDPNSGMGHKLLADAALAADLPLTAILSLEILTKNNPKDTEAAEELGQAYLKSGQVEKAETIYTELLQNDPNNPNWNQTLKNLSAQKTMDQSGYGALADGSGSYRDILRDKKGAVSLEQEGRLVKDDAVAASQIATLEARFAANPENVRLLRSIAELYLQKKEFDRALENYQRLATSDRGYDPSLEKAISDTLLAKFNHALEQLDALAPDYATQRERLQQERDNFLLDDCRKRMERYPNDLQIRFELGEHYFRAGKISEAIQEFQKAQNNPQRRFQSLSYLGQCFAKRNMNDLAVRTLENALKEKLVFDEDKKELIYFLGNVLEKMGKKNEAIEHFKQIYEVDIGYKDVAAKVDAFYASS